MSRGVADVALGDGHRSFFFSSPSSFLCFARDILVSICRQHVGHYLCMWWQR